MPKVMFVNEKKKIEVAAGRQPAQAALKAGVEVYKGRRPASQLPGHGLCGTCRVLVKKGMENLTSKTLIEKLNLTLHP